MTKSNMAKARDFLSGCCVSCAIIYIGLLILTSIAAAMAGKEKTINALGGFLLWYVPMVAAGGFWISFAVALKLLSHLEDGEEEERKP